MTFQQPLFFSPELISAFQYNIFEFFRVEI